MKQRRKEIRRSEQSREATLNECLHRVIYQWGDGFCASSHFGDLQRKERLLSESIAGFFTDLMFSDLGRAPPDWDTDTMKECCLRLFPEKVCEGPGFFECIVPVLSAFFTYLEEQNLQKNAGAMAREMNNLRESIMDESSCPENWGISKQFIMAARSDGIDITNQKKLIAYMVVYNEKIRKEGQIPDTVQGTLEDNVVLYTGYNVD